MELIRCHCRINGVQTNSILEIIESFDFLALDMSDQRVKCLLDLVEYGGMLCLRSSELDLMTKMIAVNDEYGDDE